MTWSISAAGTRDEAIASVKGVSGPPEGASDHDQFLRARRHILDELVSVADDAVVSVSASGHQDSTTSYESLLTKSAPAPSEG